jgi:putative transposase
VTYIPMQRGFHYLVAIMDWATRTVLSWRLSNTQDSAFCREALQEALARYGKPDIFNTDQGSQFTSRDFTEVLEQAGGRDLDGRQGPMEGQRLYRASLALSQV